MGLSLLIRHSFLTSSTVHGTLWLLNNICEQLNGFVTLLSQLHWYLYHLPKHSFSSVIFTFSLVLLTLGKPFHLTSTYPALTSPVKGSLTSLSESSLPSPLKSLEHFTSPLIFVIYVLIFQPSFYEWIFPTRMPSSWFEWLKTPLYVSVLLWWLKQR